MIVISNTTPLNYLILIGLIEVLPALYGQVAIPEAVFSELQRDKTPQVVRDWIANRPLWLLVRPVETADQSLESMHAGEREEGYDSAEFARCTFSQLEQINGQRSNCPTFLPPGCVDGDSRRRSLSAALLPQRRRSNRDLAHAPERDR